MFRFEAEMLPVIAENLDEIIQDPGRRVLAYELPVDTRVVDLAVATLSDRALESVLGGSHLSRLRAAQLDILGRIVHAQVITIRGLSKATYLTASRLRVDYLDAFLEMGLISRVSRYCYAPTEWALHLPALLVTIEAKLSRPQQVLAQALDNLVFADKSYAALPETYPRQGILALKTAFGSAGVGLIQVGQGLKEVLAAASPQRVSLGGVCQRLRLIRDLQAPEKRHKKWRLV